MNDRAHRTKERNPYANHVSAYAPGDYDAALAPWAEIFATDPHTERREFRCDRRYLAHTHLTVDGSGTLLATAHYWTHRIRDAGGVAQRVGCLSRMATRPESRRQGHATRLLEHAIEWMCREGRACSLRARHGVRTPRYRVPPGE